MKILIKDNWALNLGDVAIAEAMISEIQSVYPDCEIMLESSHPEVTEEYFKNNNKVRVIERLFTLRGVTYKKNIISLNFFVHNIPQISRLLYTFVYSYIVITFGLSTSNTALQAYRESDYILSAGGDFLSINYAYYLRLYEFYLIKKLKKPLVIYAQSIGPFHSTLTPLAMKMLSKIDAILARDESTFNYLLNNGVSSNVYRTADSVALLKTNMSDRAQKVVSDMKIDDMTIGFVIRDSKQASIDEAKYNEYIDAVSYIINEYKKKYNIILIAPNRDDYEASLIVVGKTGSDIQVLLTSSYMPSEVKYIFSQLSLIVSSRMHPVIIATTVNTPVICIGLEFKMRNYMKLIGMEGYYLDMDKVDIYEYMSIIDKVLENREKISEDIKKNMQQVKDLSKRNMQILSDVINKNK